jgi:hypothetical protein
MADQDERPEDEPKAGRRPNAATKLVQIATEMYEFRRTADSHRTSGDVVSEGHVYAVLKDDPSRRSELSDIREVIAEIYEMRHGSVPSRTALGDAMTVLKGKARKAMPDEAPGDPAGDLVASHGISEEPDGWEVKDAASAYELRGGALGWYRPVRDGGAVWTPLATFDAEITEEAIRDDGAEQSLTWTVRVATTDGRTGEVTITPDQLGRPQLWAAKAAGVSALVMPGLSVADHLRVAVQSRSVSVSRKVIYTHTGWRQIDGHWAHLTSSGALGAAGLNEAVTVDLGPAGGYALPDVPGVRAVREAVRKSLELIDLAPDTVTVPWLAATYRAPLPLPPDCGVWIYGPSGTFKTEQTALGQQHYGPAMHAKNLPGNWTSSANDLEVTAFMLDGVLFVVDDYSPDVTKLDAAKRAAAADRLIRGSANHSGRGRLRPDGTRRPVKPPRGQVLTSAEDIPPGGTSMRARTFVVKVVPGDVSIAALTAAQKTAADGTYAAAIAGYVQSLAVRYDADGHLGAAFTAARNGYRDRAKSEGHPRGAENIASLALGWHEFLAFAEDIGAITAAERAACWSRAWTALCAVGAEQEAYAADTDPVGIYLSSLRALIASGRVHIAANDGGCPPENPVRWGWTEGLAGAEPLWRPQGELVGWTDGADVYLESSIAYKFARQHSEAEGQPLTTSKRMLHEHLKERKLLASAGAKGHITSRHRLGGAQQTVVHLTISAFDGEAA